MIGKKEFTEFAIALRNSNASEETIKEVVEVLKGLNPRFDEERFLNAVNEGKFFRTPQKYLTNLRKEVVA